MLSEKLLESHRQVWEEMISKFTPGSNGFKYATARLALLEADPKSYSEMIDKENKLTAINLQRLEAEHLKKMMS